MTAEREPARAQDMTLALVPEQQLVQRRDSDGRGYWRAMGNDPFFMCRSRDAFPLAGGWYAVRMEIEEVRDALVRPMLYPDYGIGARPENRIDMPLVRQGGASECLIRLVSNAQALRFDPTMSACDFRIGELHLTRLSKYTAVKWMLRGCISRQGGWTQRLRLLAGTAVQLLFHGPSRMASRLYDVYSHVPEVQVPSSYASWLRLYDPPEWADAYADISVDPALRLASLRHKPLLSVVVPTWETREEWLRRCIDSVRSQVYPHWELCIADDASPSPRVRAVLDEYAARDPRIKVVYRSENGHIAAASNSALSLATGEFVALLDHDDELHPHALLEVAAAIGAHPDWRVIFSDEDKIDEQGNRYGPYFKPDWNYDLFLSQNCICHLGVYATALLREVGGFSEGLDGSQDWDLALRCVERLRADQIGHIPKVLYHWRAIPGSTALSADQKVYAQDAAMKSICAHLERKGVAADVERIEKQPGNYRVRYRLPSPPPLVSLIIPTRDKPELLDCCVTSVLENTDYPELEILIVDNQSREQATFDLFKQLGEDARVHVLQFDAPFNYSAINNFAAARARGTVLGLLNNDIEVIAAGWLTEMVSQACRPEIGAVGAMLYYPDDTVHHAGVVTGVGSVAGHVFHRRPRGDLGYFNRMALVQDLSVVTAACLVVRRSVYEEVGGLDEQLHVAFNDVDFCLRVQARGYRNLWTPYAELYHHESASRGYETTPEKWARFQQEARFLQQRWGEQLQYDPAYNPNLTTVDTPYGLAFPPRPYPGNH